jgi:acetylxylan esterase
MVKYALTKYHADPERVYATGVGSGAMMTNVLLGSCPDVFAAGAAFAGVPLGCFAGTTSWNTACAEGRITKSPFDEAVKQRTDVPGLSRTPTSTDRPQPTWTRARFADSSGAVRVETVSMQGVPHNLPVVADEAIHFFGLDFFGLDADGPSQPSSTPTVGPGG